ncbi:MAG: LysR family transcriptional regulator [Nocardioidaceae bacterium]
MDNRDVARDGPAPGCRAINASPGSGVEEVAKMSGRPSLRQLEYFLAAVEHGSFAAAANELLVAQPSLSEQIKRLERIVGGRLFVRTNRNLQLTDMGRQLIPLAQTTLRSADVLVDRVRDMRTLEGGSVSFGTFSSAHMYLLVPVTSEFNLRHPEVQIRVVGLNSSDVASMVREGELEAGLVQLPVDERGLDVGPVALVDTVVFASADPRRTTSPMTIDRLAESRLILSEARWGEADPLRFTIARRAHEAGLDIKPFVEVEFQTAALELAANGVGDTLVSYLVTRLPRFANLISWAPLEPVLEELFAMVTRTHGGLSPATRAFMEMAHRHISALQASANSVQL